MEKRAYSQLKRGEDNLIRVVFNDVDSGLPVDDLTGYTIVALDESGQSLVPINQAKPSTPPQPASVAELPRVSAEDATYDQLVQRSESERQNGGAVAQMDLEPVNGFLGPKGMVSAALGNDLDYTNTGWKNKALQTGIGIAAGAAVGGPVGMVAGALAGGIVNSDKFKNRYNDQGQLNKFGVGMGLPKAPQGETTTAAPFGAEPTASNPTPVDNLVGNTQNIGQQRTNIPTSSTPIDGGYQNTDMKQAPSMSAFNRREPPTGSKGTVENFDRTGLSPQANSMVDRIAKDVPGLGVNSGFRSAQRNAEVGGAKSSQHIQGNAIDINVAGMSNEQKRDVLESAVRGGARGVGIYASGNSLHVDVRDSPTTWGPSGYTGSGIGAMPEWSRDTLEAMYGAGPTGQVGPRLGPTPKSREQALREAPIESRNLGPVSIAGDDLAFTSRPNFKDMTTGQVASSGFGQKPSEAQIDAMAYTLAGELDPTEMNNPTAVANLAATINNRVQTVGIKDTFTGTQYNSLMPENRRVTEANYKEFGQNLKQNIRDFYDGKNAPTTPDATHYYNPDIANPAWGGKLQNTVYEGKHTIGNIPGEYENTKQAAAEVRRQADDSFTSRSLASQAGRNVENTDKSLSGDKRTSLTGSRGFGSRSKEERDEQQARDRQRSSASGSLEGSRYSDGKGFGSRSGNSSVSSRTGSGKDKDDRGVGARSSASTSSSKSGGLNTSNAKGMSTRSKDDNTSSSKSSTSKSSSKSESSVSKSVASEKSKDKGEKKSGV